MQLQKFDVIIVGAGPAGTSTAIRLGGSGLKVALLDKENFPRDKTCGDALSVDVVDQLSKLSDGLPAEFEVFASKLPSYGVKIFSPDHRFIDIPFIYNNTKRCGYICPRKDFDNLLFQHVRRYRNVQIFENCSVNKVIRDNSKLLLKTSIGDLEGQMIIGADGAHSVIAKNLSKIKVEKEHYSAGLRVYYEQITGFHHENYIELHFFKDILPGYLWIFPLKDNVANVGIGMLSSMVSKKNVNMRETLQKLLKTSPHLQERFLSARPLENIKGFGLPLGSKKRTLSGERFLLAGDAASLIDPFSGEGIANAIRSGRVAADHVIRCFQEQDFSTDFNKAYDKEIYQRMWKEFRVSRSLQRLVKYSSLFNFLIKKANRNKHLHDFFTQALANVDQKKLLTKPSFYYRMFFK